MVSKISKQVKQLLKSAVSSSQKRMTSNKAIKKSRKGRSRTSARRQNASGLNMMGSELRVSNDAAAVSYSISNPTYLQISRSVSHPDFGDGVRIVGRQLLTDITTTAGDLQCFGSGGTATVAGINFLHVSPDYFNGRLALQARNYSRYAFRELEFHYIPRVATSDVGQFALAYSIDGAESAYATNSFATLTSMAPSMVTAFRKECVMRMTYKGDLTWNTEGDVSTNSLARQTVQGQLLGHPDLTSIGAVQHGWLWVRYVIDLYGQNTDYGFTLRAKNQEEQDVCRKALEKFRLTEDDDEWDTRSAKVGGGGGLRKKN